MGFRSQAVKTIPVKDVLYATGLISAFLCAVWVLRSFHPEGSGFEAKGARLLAYQASRIILLVFIATTATVLGGAALRALGVNASIPVKSARKFFILSFFLGMTIYGIGYAALGLAGLLSLPGALAGTLPVLLFAVAPIRQFASATKISIFELFDSAPFRRKAFYAALLGASGLALAIFLTMNVIAVATTDPNIWEHYLHYYRQVLNFGSTQPHEVWHHFFASKMAGFFFMADELSDFFGAPIINGAFVIATCVIIVDVIEDYCEDLSLGVFGAALFLTFMTGEWAYGTMFKHHIAILGYAALALWTAIQLRAEHLPSLRWAIIGTATLSFLYMGVYASLIGVIFPAAFLFVGLGNIATGQRWNFIPLFTFAIAAASGTALSFLLNYWITGVPDITPMRFLWPLSDQAKAISTFGLGGIEYFLRTNNDVSASSGASDIIGLLWRYLRFPLPDSMLAISAVAALAIAAIDWRDRSRRSTLVLLVTLVAFPLPFSILAEAFQSHAVVYRAGLLTIVFTVAGAVIFWQRLVRRLVDCAILQFANGARYRLLIYDLIVGTLMVLSLYGAGVTSLGDIGREQFGYARRYALGSYSLADLMSMLEPKINKQTVGVEGAIRVRDLADYLKGHVAPGDRIMRLTYEAGYSNALPGAGILSEPTYALVDDPNRLIAAEPQEVASYLKRKKIEHFIINLRASLFSTVAFTKLFDPAVMDRYFDVSYRNDDLFILTWREAGKNGPPLPKSLIIAMDIKRTGVLMMPFSKEFEQTMLAGDYGNIDTFEEAKRLKDEFLEKLGQEGQIIERRLSSREGQATLEYLWWKAIAESGKFNASSQWQTRCWTPACHLGMEDPEIVNPISAHRLRQIMLEQFRSNLRAICREEFGPFLAPLFEGTNEREPFGPLNARTETGPAASVTPR